MGQERRLPPPQTDIVEVRTEDRTSGYDVSLPLGPLSPGLRDENTTGDYVESAVSPLDAGSLAAAGPDLQVRDAQERAVRFDNSELGASLGLGFRGAGVSVGTDRVEALTGFATHGREAPPPVGSVADVLRRGDEHGLGIQEGLSHRVEQMGGGGASFAVEGATIVDGPGPVDLSLPDIELATLSENEGRGRDIAVYRPDDGARAEDFRITTSEYGIDRQEAGFLGWELDTETREGTAYTYDYDPESEEAQAAMLEYMQTGLMPGARELTERGTEEERLAAQRQLAEFDEAMRYIEMLRSYGPAGFMGGSIPSMHPGGMDIPVGGSITRSMTGYAAAMQTAMERLNRARSGLNGRWQEEFALSAGGDGEILPGLSMVREDQFRSTTQVEDGLFSAEETRTATTGTTWTRTDGETRRHGYGS